MSQSLKLEQYQQLVKKLVKERGYDDETVSEVFLLLVEEVGELGKAIRKNTGMRVSEHSKQHALADELADIFWLIVDLANRLGINLDEAFAQKELINQKRDYKPAKDE
jgi:NTP pyrophosphatase (non-canonical NTP hydrolase)